MPEIAGMSLCARAPRSRLRIATVILAAGRVSRMGGGKVLRSIGEKPMLAHVADLALATGQAPVIVIVGESAGLCRDALAGRDVTVVVNGDVALGLSGSLALGLAEVPDEYAGALVMLADMPAIRRQTLRALVAAARDNPAAAAVVPVCDGRRGNPVLLMRPIFEQAASLTGDTGARQLLRGDNVLELRVEDAGIHLDIDTPDQLEAYRLATGTRSPRG
jgi:molybdenum cofactor cytidylyltransferase